MFPETILVTNAVRDLLGHEDCTDAGVPVCFCSQNQKKAGSVVEEWQTLRRDPSRQLECPAVRYRRRAPRRVSHPSLDQAINGEGRPRSAADSRPIPHVTSSKMKRAPYFLQTDFMALK